VSTETYNTYAGNAGIDNLLQQWKTVLQENARMKSLKIQRGNENPYIEEQTTQWPKEKVQKDKQRSTKHTYKTKDRVTRTPLKPEV
jgi:hypothetical protein